jgi:hypothetical protein
MNPFEANCLAASNPIPLFAPVTTAYLFCFQKKKNPIKEERERERKMVVRFVVRDLMENVKDTMDGLK